MHAYEKEIERSEKNGKFNDADSSYLFNAPVPQPKSGAPVVAEAQPDDTGDQNTQRGTGKQAKKPEIDSTFLTT